MSRGMCFFAQTGRYPDLRMEAGAILAEAPPKFALLGHSMGGYLALEIMRRAPERVTRLALISTRASGDTPEQRERRELLIGMAEGDKLNEIFALLWPAYVHSERLEDEPLRNVVLQMLLATGSSGFAAQQRAILSRINYWGVLPSIRVPTSVIVGADDLVTPPDQSRAISKTIPGSDLTVIRDCGHLAPLERPMQVSSALERWLS
ncbi:alpha/beta fold hydrolase [Terrarubrum flagellatum]|uniref:alpha/beta fold hydrolase n=1 Tax=Terrirubrum flagellatum TaxID=2895980 RepID=UPI0031454F20